MNQMHSILIHLKHFFNYTCHGKLQKKSKNVSDYLRSTKGKRVVVIIDGYEQFFSEPNSDHTTYIMDIVYRKIVEFQMCDLIVSTRHAALIDFNGYENWYRIELLGFTEELQQQYIECSLDNSESQNDVINLKNYLKSRPTLESLCFHPLFLNYLVSIHQKLKVLPILQSELINNFACIMMLWILRNQQVLLILNITSLFKNLTEYQNNLMKIAELAFYTLREGKICCRLDQKYIKESGVFKLVTPAARSYKVSLGFLKVFKISGNRELMLFPNSVMQQFLAAFFVMQSGNKMMNLWSDTKWSIKYINVWAYYFGLIGVVEKDFENWLFDSKFKKDKMKCIYLVYCLMELPDEKIYQQAKQVVFKNDNFLDISNYNLANESLNIVASFLSCYLFHHWSHFSLSNCCLNDEKLVLFHVHLCNVKCIPIVDTLDLSNNQLTGKSIIDIFKIAHRLNVSQVLLSHNEKVTNIAISQKLISFTKLPFKDDNLKVVKSDRSVYLFCSKELHAISLVTTLTDLYIIKCTLALEDLVTVLRTCKKLSLLYIYDSKLPYSDLCEVLKLSMHLTSVLIFEKYISTNVCLNMLTKYGVSRVLLVNANQLLAQGVTVHHITTALEYNSSIVHLQLNNCHITDEVMSKIAVMLIESPQQQQWSLLDLSGSKLNDDSLRGFCNVLDGNSIVNVIRLANNELTSLTLIAKLIQCLKPSTLDISVNSFKTGDSNQLSVGMVMAQQLFSYKRNLCLKLICDSGIVLLYHRLDHATITEQVDISSNYVEIFVSECTVDGEMLLRSLDNCNSLTLLYLANIKWSGEPIYNLTKFFEANIAISIFEEFIPKGIVSELVNKFDTDINVSRIISADDIFIAHKCSYELMKGCLSKSLSSKLNLFYIQNCLLASRHQKYDIVTDYFDEQNMVAEIVSCNNGLSQDSICKVITQLQKTEELKFRSIFICELQKQLHGIARQLLGKYNSSLVVMGKEITIGKQATSVQVGRCLHLVSPYTTILRFINCSLSNEHYSALVDLFSSLTTLEEFSLYECNNDEIWTKKLIEALQLKSTLTSLLLSCHKITSLTAESIATALFSVLSNNSTLKKISFKFDKLYCSACSKVFKALSSITQLKQFRFCDGQVTDKEAKNQLKKVIANNPFLEVVNLRNNKLQNTGVKIVAEGFNTICHLKILALNGNQISEEAADDIASIIANNVEIEKLLLHNNALKSEGICKVCQALKNHKSLKVFKINNNCIQEDAADDIADVISHNLLLKVVDVSDNRLLSNGMIKIISQLENITSLQKLTLSSNNFTCTEKMAVSIAKTIKNNKKLRSLYLDNNNFSNSGTSVIAESLNELTGLKELAVNNTGCTADNIIAMITNNLHLETLDIGGNKLKSTGISNISTVVMKLSQLKVLGLHNNEITDDAADDIAGLICDLPILEKLKLGNNAFGVVGTKIICKSLQHSRAIKLLQLDNVGITEEAANDIAAVIDSNTSLEYLYLGNNRLDDTGADVILNSLNRHRHLKALGLNNNCLSEAVVKNIIQIVTSSHELEELLLNKNSIGTTGIIEIADCLKNFTTLKTLSLTDNNISDEAASALLSVMESNIRLEGISFDADILIFNDKVSSAIPKLINLKCLKIDCKLAIDNAVCELLDFIFANSNVEEITVKHLVEEMLFLSPWFKNAIETVMVIKENVNESASQMPVLHSVIKENTIEIVCVKNNLLMKSEAIKMIRVKTVRRLVIVFTKANCFTDQEMNFLITTIVDYNNINSVAVCKVNASDYNRDVSGVVAIENNKMIVSLRGNSMKSLGITKLINKAVNVANMGLYAENMNEFTIHSINEITDIVNKTAKLEVFKFRVDAISSRKIENSISCLTKGITIKTVRLLNDINIRNFYKYDKLQSQSVEEMNKQHCKQHWFNIYMYIICALKHNVDIKTLSLFGISINEDIAPLLAILLKNTTKIENLDLQHCSLGMNLKFICLQEITTLKYLDLSNNKLNDVAPIITIIENNTKIEKLIIDNNCLQLTAGDKLSTAVINKRNLKVLNIDRSIIGKDVTLKLATAFSTINGRKLYIYDQKHQSTEVLDITDSLHNVTTLTLCKRSVGTKNASFVAAILKTGVLLSLWQQNNALNNSEVIRSLSASRRITTIKLLNISGGSLTEQEENAIANIVMENVQLENVLLGNHSCKSAVDDFHDFLSAHNTYSDSESEHHTIVSTSRNNEKIKAKSPSHKFLLKVIPALKCHANLKALDLSGTVITEELAEQLSIILANSTKLETLVLRDCFLGNEGVRVIGNSVKKNATLKHLDLVNNEITKELAIVNILKGSIKLTELYLHKNCLQFTAGYNISVGITNLKYLKVLSIDQNIISRYMTLQSAINFPTNTKLNRKLLLYNHDHHTFEMMDIMGSFNNINALTLCKLPIVTDQHMITFILNNGSVMLWWTQCDKLNTSGVLRYISSLKKITTIKLLNNSGSELTELEVDTIATVISENVQLESLWLGSQSLKVIIDDFVALKKESNIIKVISEDETVNKDDQSFNQQKCLALSRTKKIFQDKVLLKIVYAFQNIANVKTLDLSDNVFTEESTQTLAAVLANSTKLETLLLENCSLRNEGVKVIAVYLKNVSTLKHLDLSSNNISEIDDIVAILEANTGLEKLSIEKNCLHCVTGDKFYVAIASLINLKALSIDEGIISLISAFSTGVDLKMFIYNHDEQRIEMLDMRNSFNNINALTLCKIPIISRGYFMVTFTLNNRSVMLWWTQSDKLNTSGVLRYISSLKKITTIKVLNNSDSELTELEVDTIATVISENVQLENLWLGSQSLKVINDDFVALTKESNIIKGISEDETINRNDQSFKQQKCLILSPTKKMFPDKLLLKIVYAFKHIASVQTLDLSGNAITEESAAQLAVVLANSTKVETLLLESCSLQNLSANALVKSLQKTATLKQLNLSRNKIAEETIDNIFNIIKFNTKLELLYMDGTCSQSFKFDQLLNIFQHLTSLKELQIDSRLLVEDTRYELISTIMSNLNLQRLITRNHSLQMCGLVEIFNFSRNPESLEIICTNYKEHHLLALAHLHSNKIRIQAAQSETLLTTGLLRAINLCQDVSDFSDTSSNILSNQNVNETVKMVNFKHLEKLVIQGNISQSVVMHIYSSLLMQSTCLNKMLLCDNKIDEKAANIIAAILANNGDIQELIINNCCLSSHGAKSIMLSLKNDSLMKLSLYSNFITDEAADDIADVVSHNTAMEEFSIGENKLQAKGMATLLLSLKKLKSLKSLSICSNDISEDIMKYIIPVIAANPKLTSLDIDEVYLQIGDTTNSFNALKLSYLTYLDISRNNLHQEAVNNITHLISNCVALEDLRAHSNAIGTVGISKLSTALVTLKKLNRIDFADNHFTCTSANSIAEIITSHYLLKSLILGGDCLNCSVGTELSLVNTNSNMCHGSSLNGIEFLFLGNKMLKDKVFTKFTSAEIFSFFSMTNDCNAFGISEICIKTIELINLSSCYSNCLVCLSKLNHNKIKSDGAIMISKALTNMKSLKVFSIENNGIDDEAVDDIATALTSNTGIEQLWIGQNHFTPSGISAILQALLKEAQLPLLQLLLPSNPCLQVMDLNHSYFTSKIAIDISKLLMKNHQIRQLWLESTNLTSENVTTIAHALKECANISVLSLRKNNIYDDATEILSKALANKNDLRALYLGNNYFNDRGVIKITEALNTTHGLLTLDLMNNNISEAAADALASVIISCRILEQLYLGDNKLHSTGAIKIATAIQQAACRSTLRVLGLSNNRIGSDERVADEISRAVGNTELLTVLILDNNALSVDGLLKITRSLGQSPSAEYMMIFSVMRNDVMISEEAKDEMRAVMADQQLTDCVMYF